MERDIIQKILELGEGIKYVFISTADIDGVPHMAAARRLTIESNQDIGISEWFCPGTLSNLNANPLISIVAWDPKSDKGYQMLGSCTKIEDLSMMDGYSSKLESDSPMPQEERKLIVRVTKVIPFSYAPHSDIEE